MLLTLTEVIVAMLDSVRCMIRILAAGLLCIVALVAVPADRVQAALVKVTAVTLHEGAGELQVDIATSGPARYQQRNVRPQWVVVDVLGAELAIPAGTLPLKGAQISRVRIGQFTPDVVRVVVELAGPVFSARLTSSPDHVAVVVGTPGLAPTGQTPAIAAQSGGDVRGEIAKVTGIMLWGTASRPWVSISASGPVQYQRRDVQPDWVVVDVSRAQLALAPGKLPAGRGLVRQVRVGQFAPDIVRVVLELAEPVPIHVATSPNRATIVVNFLAETRTRPGSEQAQGDDSAPAPAAQQHVASPPPVVSAPSEASAPPITSGPLPGGPSASEEKPAVTAPPVSADLGHARAAGYLLGPEDILEITVWGYPDLTRVVTVRPDGQISVPLAGTVPVAGQSVERLTQDLTRAFAKYIIKPQVTVSVKEFRKIRISMLGQVAKPGTYTLPPGARILDAISIASGVTDNAALPQAQLVRASGETRLVSLDSLLLRQDMSQNLAVEPGDTLIIPEDTTNKFYILGDVNRPGIYPIKGDVTVLQALAIAGGPVMHGASTAKTAHIIRHVRPGDTMASVHRDEVQSIANGNGVMITKDLQKIYQGDLRQNEALQPGDVMVVPAPGIAALPTLLSILGFFWWFHP